MRRLLLAPMLVFVAACGDAPSGSRSSESLSFDWPPQVGQRYPGVTLRDLSGELVSLSQFEGRALLIDPIGMT